MRTNKADSEKMLKNEDISKTLGIDPLSEHRDRMFKRLLIAIIIVVVVAVSMLLINRDSSQAVKYRYVPIERGDLIVTVTATGTLEPVNQVEVGSEISGTVKTVAIDFNDQVKIGQVLATLNTDQLEARVNQAQAGLQLAQAQVKQAEATVIETKNKLRRSRELAKSGMCSEEDCDAAQAAYDRAEANLLSTKAQVVQSQASLDVEQTTLSKATIHSPISGIVLERSVEPGQTVAASLQTPVLFTLAEDLTQMELHVDVDEADVGQVKVGQEAQFSVDAYPEQNFPAKITEVHFASQTVAGVVTYETVLRVDNSALLLRPGMTATADITVNEIKNALLVSNAALRFTPPLATTKNSTTGSLVSQLMPRPPKSNSKSNPEENSDKKTLHVWVLRDGQPEAVQLNVGATDGIKTVILSGNLEVGMELITEIVSQDQ